MLQTIKKWLGVDEVRSATQYSISNSNHISSLTKLLNSAGGNPLAIPAVANGVRLISENCAKLSCDVFIKDDYNNREKDKKHQAAKIFKRPNSFQTWNRFMALMLHLAVLHGNYYGRIYFDEAMGITDIIPLDPRCVDVVIDNSELYYAISENGKVVEVVPAFKMLHVKGLVNNAYTGISLVNQLQTSFGYSEALTNFGLVYFKNGASIKTVLTMPKELWTNEAKRNSFMEAWNNQHTGLENSGKASFIVEGMTLDKVSMSNDESQYLAAKENDLVNISNILGVPAHYLGSKNATSHNSTVEEKQALLDFCLDPWLCNIEEEFESKLLKETEKEDESRYIEFNRKKFVGIDAKLESEILIAYYTNDLMAWEEVRAKLNMPTKRDESLKWVLAANIMKQDVQPIAQDASVATIQPAIESNNVPPPEADSKRGIALATVQRLGRRLERSNKSPLEHLSVFEESLPTLKEECKDILSEINESWNKDNRKQLTTMLVEELCQIV